MDADRLMALLYGELDAGEAERERAAVAESPEQAAELEGFERVRTLFRELPDEEPPPRISAQLLAEAARSAPAPRRAVAVPAREDGFWARLLSWLSPVQHPGFAAAASVVLVAGLAGVLYLRKGDALQKAGRAPEAPPAGSATATTGTATEEAPPPPAPAADPAAVAGEADAEGGAVAADRTRSATIDEKQLAKGGKTSPSKEKSADLDDVFAKKKREAKPTASPKKPDSLRGGTVYGLSEQEMMPGDAAGGSGGDKAANQAPPSPSPAPPQAGAAPSVPATKARPPTATELHARAVDAALDKRCTDVRHFGAEIQSIDPAYYKTKFAGDKRLKACLETPSQYPARK